MNKAAPNHTTKPAAHHAAHRHKGVLSGIRVLDFTWKTVGPWAPRLLTHYGAEVIHVERAGSWDDHRFTLHRSPIIDGPPTAYQSADATGPMHGGGRLDGTKKYYAEPYFTTLHHGKLAISLNTRHPKGLKLANRLIGISDAFHPLSHHTNDKERLLKLVKIQTYHVQRFADFVAKIAAIPDGDGSLLDHSLFMYGSNMSNSDRHNNYPLPNILVGGACGALKGGRHVELPEHTTLTNLHLTVLNKAGLELKSFAESTGEIAGV